jgi:hypothetical protein
MTCRDAQHKNRNRTVTQSTFLGLEFYDRL